MTNREIEKSDRAEIDRMFGDNRNITLSDLGKSISIYHHGSLNAKCRLFENLTPKERAIYACKKIGMTWDEAHEAWGDTPVDTLRSRYKRACVKMEPPK